MEETKSDRRKIRDVLLPPGPRTVAEPEKELRFTRARQAWVFFALAAVILSAGMTLLALAIQNWGLIALLKVWWWLLLAGSLLGLEMLRLGVRCTRHAYIILSPLGVEIFPFFKARQNLQVIYWSQIADAEVRDGNLVLHFSEEKKSGIIASLKPIPTEGRMMLEKAVAGVMEKRDLIGKHAVS